MKYNYNDLEIIILTFNRAEYLEQTLTSICNQTAKGFKITVFDNGSTDNTPQTVEKFASYGVELNRNEKNSGSLENFKKAQLLASKEWTMVFHDDDLLHPEYIETAFKFINKYDNIALISTSYRDYENPTNEGWKALSQKAYYCKDIRELAALLYSGISYNFAATIYRTDFFKKTNPEYEIYGKVSDRPFVLDVAKNGCSIVLKDRYVRYRIHAGQDTSDSKSGPFINEIIALNRKYHEILGDSIFSPYGRVFIARNYKLLFQGYSWFKNNNRISLESFFDECIEKSAATRLSILFGKIRKHPLMVILRILSYPVLSKKFNFVHPRN